MHCDADTRPRDGGSGKIIASYLDALTGSQPVPRVKENFAMHISTRIRARPLRVTDFPFVRRLASRHRHFTVPPSYVLWLLKRTNRNCCIVVEHPTFGPVAYLLSILMCEDREKVLYVWQLAASTQGVRSGAIDVALVALRSFVRRARVEKLLFTIDPESSEFRAVRRYVYSLFSARVRPGDVLPRGISRHEREYAVRLP